MEKNLGQRCLVILAVIVIGAVLLWPPERKLRPGLDIAGGTSLIFEIDTTAAEGELDLAERVKTLLQKRVDPAGVYNLTWRVHGRNRLEVQMPLPPRDATERRAAYARALEDLYSYELRRGAVEAALRLSGAERDAALRRLARGRADEALAAAGAARGESWRAAVERVVAQREARLLTARDRYDALRAAEAARAAGPPVTQPAADTAPADLTATQAASEPSTRPITQASLEEDYRDALELLEEAIQDVLATNLNHARFEEILGLEPTSKVRAPSLEEILERHADLRDKLEDVIAKHAEYRRGKRFLDSPADLKRLLRGAGKLEFRIVAAVDRGNPTRYDRYREQLKQGRLRRPGDELGWFKIDNPLQFFDLESEARLETYKPEEDERFVVGKLEKDFYVLCKLSPDDGLLHDVKGQRKWRLNAARVRPDEHGGYAVDFELDVVGGQYFESLTRRNIDKPLAILVDDVAYSAPSIRSAIGTRGQITGDFGLEKARWLQQTMEGGTLPARLKDTPLSERTIGSSLGETNRDNAVRAGLIGTLAVIAVMIGYYLLCGAIANVAMLLNVFLTLAALAMLGARITLDGIAGLILAVGMSVDANVLIYERMREEKARGSSLRMVIKNGYDRALSTIFDSNMTTLLTCVIIYYVGSEEVKGFGLTLGWGIVLNLFTAVFVSRTIFDLLLRYNLIKDVKMLSLIKVPNIDWCSKTKYVVPVSLVLLIAGVSALFVRGPQHVLDIEFLGGVAAEFEVKPPGPDQTPIDDVVIARRIQGVADGLAQDARRLGEVVVTPVAGEVSAFDVRLEGVDGPRLAAMLTEPLEAQNLVTAGGVTAHTGNPVVRLHVPGEVSADKLTAAIHGLGKQLVQTADNLGRSNVNAVLEAAGGGPAAAGGLIWNVTTTATNMRLVKYALIAALGSEMRIQPSIEYTIRGQGERPFAITDRLLNAVVPDLPPDVNADLTDYLGGAAIYLEQLDPPQSVSAIRERLDNMHFQPDFADLPKRRFEVIGVKPAAHAGPGQPLYSSVVIVTADPDIRYQEDPQGWLTGLVQPEMNLVRSALTSEQTLRKVMQFKPQIAARATYQALFALVLSWLMVIGYVWVRFGKVRYGVGGVAALIHDVLAALAFVGFSGWLADTAVGRALLVQDFKINMPIIAALLTIIGFSINDTIVIFDRIRELRGRLGIVTRKTINDSVNECLSRTILTTFTVLLVVTIGYIFGGSSIRGFNYCFLIGCISGTYSTMLISPALLLLRSGQREAVAARTA